MARRSRDIYVVAAIQVASVCVLMLLLYVASRLYPVLPSPFALGQASIDLLQRVALYREMGVTLYESVIGLAIAALLGVASGIAIGANRTANDVVTPIIVAFYWFRRSF